MRICRKGERLRLMLTRNCESKKADKSGPNVGVFVMKSLKDKALRKDTQDAGPNREKKGVCRKVGEIGVDYVLCVFVIQSLKKIARRKRAEDGFRKESCWMSAEKVETFRLMSMHDCENKRADKEGRNVRGWWCKAGVTRHRGGYALVDAEPMASKLRLPIFTDPYPLDQFDRLPGAQDPGFHDCLI